MLIFSKTHLEKSSNHPNKSWIFENCWSRKFFFPFQKIIFETFSEESIEQIELIVLYDIVGKFFFGKYKIMILELGWLSTKMGSFWIQRHRLHLRLSERIVDAWYYSSTTVKLLEFWFLRKVNSANDLKTIVLRPRKLSEYFIMGVSPQLLALRQTLFALLT